MMRRQRATALTDQVRHGQVVLAADLGHGVHHVVGVLLRRVVDARLGRGIGTVVVHAQPTTHVHVRHVHAHATQLGVEARDFLQTRLDVADVGNLAAKMEVDQLQNVEATQRLELVDQLHQLRHVEPELALLATALRPAPETR